MKIFEFRSGLVLLCFFLVVKIFVTIIWRHNHFNSAFCSFVDAISTELRAWRHFSLLWSKFSVHRVRNFLVSRDLTFTQNCLPHIFQLYSFFSWFPFRSIHFPILPRLPYFSQPLPLTSQKNLNWSLIFKKFFPKFSSEWPISKDAVKTTFAL